MSCTDSADSLVEEAFDWDKYLEVKIAKPVPRHFFHHIYKSLPNGIECESIVEIENENGYWLASVRESEGGLVNLYYFGDVNNTHILSLRLNSSRIHPLNWGIANNKRLVPPNNCFQSNLKEKKSKIENSEHVESNQLLKLTRDEPIHSLIKTNMLIEIQDKEYPYHVWISIILKNIGGRLLIKVLGESSLEKKPFWLFYSNRRVFPLGWADQNGLPWIVMNSNVDTQCGIDSNVVMDVIKPKLPAYHSYNVGEMLEVLNPFSLMVFHVAKIIKIYDNRYFKVEINNERDVDKRITFLATKENPYLFNAGWAKKHNFILKPPPDGKTLHEFCWTEYEPMKDLKFAFFDTTLKKTIDHSYIGMKLEAVDPVKPNCIRIATIKGFADHWMFLSFDRSTSTQELVHIRSVYSDEVFPVGWCDEHNYPLTTPKCPYVDYDYNEHCYYESDVEIDFNSPDEECLTKYSDYCKGELFYHYSKCYRLNSNQESKEKLEMFIKSVMSNDYYFGRSSPTVSFAENDEHNPLKLDVNAHTIIAVEKNVENRKKKISLKNNTEILNTNERNLCVYFNKACYSGVCVLKKKLPNLPKRIGPGLVPKVLQDAITKFVGLNCNPATALKKIKNIQKTLFNGPGGVELLITTNETLKSSDHSEILRLPESIMMAQKYCSSLCNLFGTCEYFMTTKNKPCSQGCTTKEMTTSELNLELGTIPSGSNTKKRKILHMDFENSDDLLKNVFIKKYNEIIEVAGKELDWSNESLVKRFKYYMGCIINYEVTSVRIEQNLSPNELAVVAEIQTKKNILKIMDNVDVFMNTKAELINVNNENRLVFDNWKSFFENYYRNDPRFKDHEIDIGNFKTINVTSNPKYWSPKDVYLYLLSDSCCKSIVDLLFNEEVDGSAFMLLNEEILMQNFRCSINLAIRLMCHVAQVNHIFLKKYNTQN